MKSLIRLTATVGKDHTVLSLLRNAWPGLIWRLCVNPHTPKQWLTDWMTHESASIRARVAENPGTPIDVIEVLRHDSVPEVKDAANQALRQRYWAGEEWWTKI